MLHLQFHYLSIIKTISGVGFLICLLTKVGLHVYLDFATNRITSIAVYQYTPFVFFKSYSKINLMQYSGARFICNACLYAFYFLSVINLAVGTLMLFLH